MKAQFNKVKNLAKKYHQESTKLDRMIDSKYGFNYSETDDAEIIDTLDYGTDDITFEDFNLKMLEFKNREAEN